MDVIIFSALILLSAFFSSAETAFFSLSPARIRLMRHKKIFASEIIDKLKHRPRRLLITILIGNNIVNLFTASYATVVAARFFDSGALGIATGVTTLFILIFGEIIPKSFAIAQNTQIAQFSAWPIYILFIIFYPIIWILQKISISFQRLLGADKQDAAVSEEEIRTMTRIGVEHGIFDYREHEMIQNVFEFDDIKVKDVMTPLRKIVMLDGNVPIEQISYFVSQSGHSRYPVHDGNDDHIIGYIHVNTIMKALNSDKRNKPVEDFVSPVQYVKDDIDIERVFRRMNKRFSHMFLVRSKKNNDVIGLITLEDVLEELVGEIIDETDTEEQMFTD